MESCIRVMAGSVVLLSVVLSQIHSVYWLALTAFAGLNLLQSGFTGICLPTKVLGRLPFCRDTSCA